ncbi:hypothetical protein OPQ81_001661 [Rhizoctonia solani]|nr:hypothetical protein OPQ81_001661 [Rhizoctonia solani]
MEYWPEILWQREDHIRLGQLHSYLIGDDAESRNLPPAFHKVLEKHGNLLLTQFKVNLLTQLEKILKDTLAHLQANQPPLSPHTPPRAEPQSVEDTPKAPTGLGHSNKLDFFIPTKSGEEPQGKGKSIKGNPLQIHLISPGQNKQGLILSLSSSHLPLLRNCPESPKLKSLLLPSQLPQHSSPLPSGDNRGEGG